MAVYAGGITQNFAMDNTENLREHVMINQFEMATGCTKEQSRQILQASRWEYLTALSMFFQDNNAVVVSAGGYSQPQQQIQKYPIINQLNTSTTVGKCEHYCNSFTLLKLTDIRNKEQGNGNFDVILIALVGPVVLRPCHTSPRGVGGSIHSPRGAGCSIHIRVTARTTFEVCAPCNTPTTPPNFPDALLALQKLHTSDWSLSSPSANNGNAQHSQNHPFSFTINCNNSPRQVNCGAPKVLSSFNPIPTLSNDNLRWRHKIYDAESFSSHFDPRV
uniref:UBA-like domain-containing protein n=1 Tax=Romanomermis culicivorax TaxID=13658 RepID=A0A915HKW7_ROMCU